MYVGYKISIINYLVVNYKGANTKNFDLRENIFLKFPQNPNYFS